MARPVDIKLHQMSRLLEIRFDDETEVAMSCEFLRVHSPSAEVQGHGPGQEVLQVGKEDVNIVALEPAGNYALKIVFDDGHDSGLYTWNYLYQLGHNQTTYWARYLDRLKEAGHEHDAMQGDGRH